MRGIIATTCWPIQSSLLRTNQTANKYGTTRANMSRVINKGVMMNCKVVIRNSLTVLGPICKPSTDNVKPKGSVEAYLSIG